MRSSRDEKKISAMFEADLPNGDCLISPDCSGSCQQTFTVGMVNDEPLICSICQREIVFRPWCDW